MALYRLSQAKILGDWCEIATETRFVFLALGPRTRGSTVWELSERGRAVAVLLGDKVRYRTLIACLISHTAVIHVTSRRALRTTVIPVILHSLNRLIIIYPPSERSETGGYAVFTFVCLSVSVCVCSHSVQSSTVCVLPTTRQPSPSCNPSPSPKIYKSCKKIHLADICTL